MKKKGLSSKILSVLLAFSIVIGTMPMDTFAVVPGVDKNSTSENVQLIQNYALQLRNDNTEGEKDSKGNKRNSYAKGYFTWDTEGKNRSWTYYTGVMLDSFMMLESYKSTTDEGYTSYLKEFYKDLIVYDSSTGKYSIALDGDSSQYKAGELDSVEMGRPLFDLLPDKSGLPEATSVSDYVVDLDPTTEDPIAEVDGSIIKFNDPASGATNGGNGVTATNPLKGRDLSDTDDVVISFWVTPKENIASESSEKTPLISFVNNSIDGEFQFMNFDIEGSLKYRKYGDDYAQVEYSAPSVTMTKDTPYFMTVVFGKSNFYYYINGELITYNASSDSNNYYFSPSNKEGTLSNAKKVLSNDSTVMYIGGVDISKLVEIESISNGSLYSSQLLNDLPEGTIVRDVNAYVGSICDDGDDTTDEATAVSAFAKKLYNSQAIDYKEIIQFIYDELEKQSLASSSVDVAGNFKHKTEWSWGIGLDGLYMAQPFLMEYANAVKNGKIESAASYSDIYKEVAERLVWINNNMRDKTTGLYHHAWKDDNGGTLNNVFWGRGIGWYAATLVDVIELMPKDSTCDDYIEDLKACLKDVFDGMIFWQDANTGMWHNVVNREADFTLFRDKDGKEEHKNNLETSASALMAYSLMKAYNNGYMGEVTSEEAIKYGKAGLKAFNGIVENKVTTTDGKIVVSDIYRQSSVYTTDEEYLIHPFVEHEAKGTGPLIMASTLANTTAANLNVEKNPDVTEELRNLTYGIIATGSGATSMKVEDKSDDQNIVTAANKYGLDEGFFVYDISFDVQPNAATILIAPPSGAKKEYFGTYEGADSTIYKFTDNFAVYEYIDGELVEVIGTFDAYVDKTYTPNGIDAYSGYFSFKTQKPGIYVIGTKGVVEDRYDWVEIPRNDGTYEIVNSMDDKRDYIITHSSNMKRGLAAGKEKCKLEFNSVTPNDNLYTIEGVTDAHYWRYDGNDIYNISDNDTDYYLYSSDLDISSGTDASKSWKITTHETVENAVYIINDENYYLCTDSNGYKLKKYDTGSSSWSQTALVILSEATDKVVFTGVDEYTINVGDTTLTTETIQRNANIYKLSNDKTKIENIGWESDDIDIEWSPSIGDVTSFGNLNAGKYTMTVKYLGEPIGIITVNVKDTESVIGDSWKTLCEATYIRVQEMSSNSSGYVFTWGNNKNTGSGYHTWWIDENGSYKIYGITDDGGQKVKDLIITTISGSDDVYSIIDNDNNQLGQNKLWYIDDLGHIYAYNNKQPLYLNYENSGLSLSDNASSTWTVEASIVKDVSYIKVDDSEVYLKIGSKGTSSAGFESSQKNLIIYEKNTVTDVALTGQLNYEINQNDELLTLQDILDNAQLYTKDKNGVISAIDWDDSFVSYSWDKGDLNTAVADTYNLIVKYGNEEVGRIEVIVDDLKWKEIDGTVSGEVTYTTVNEMDPNHADGYVIRDRNVVNTTDGQPTLSLSYLKGGAIEKTVLLSVSGPNSLNQYVGTLSDVDDDMLWVIDNDGRIISKDSTEGTYYILGNNSLEVTTEDSKATLWQAISAEESSNPERSHIYNKESESGTKYLRRNGDGFALASKNSIVIWQRNVPQNDSVALNGTTSYTIKQGDTSLTDAVIKANASIIRGKSGDESTWESIPWYDPTVSFEWSGDELDVNTPGDYTALVAYTPEGGTEFKLGEITVTVKEYVVIDKKLSGNTEAIKTAKGREPNFGGVVLTVTYNDGTVEKVTIADGLTITGYDVEYTEEPQTASVYYNGEIVGYVTIDVQDDPFYGLEDATYYPGYPDEGAVKIHKFADNSDFLFNTTGVTKVELDVAGVSQPSGLDVVLIVDVSNSMGWTDDWFDGKGDVSQAKDADKIPYDKGGNPSATDSNTPDKLDAAMGAATSFANSLLSGNVSGGDKNNTLSFVTFAGYDENNTAETGNKSEYVDSVQTVFTGVETYSEAENSFSHTKFYKYDLKEDGEGVNYYLQIADKTGNVVTNKQYKNRGNTNYDYAFSEAKKAVDKLHDDYDAAHDTPYDKTDRKTIVLFLNDGAPSHYNDERADGGDKDLIYGTSSIYSPIGEYTDSSVKDESTWTPHISKPNKYAVELSSVVDEFYAVGFDLSHGGFDEFYWTEKELEPVLWNLMGTDATGKTKVKGVELPDNTDELVKFFDKLAKQLKHSGSNATVTDIIDDAFTLQIGESFNYVEQIENPDAINTEVTTKVEQEDGTIKEETVEPKIQVYSYDLWTQKEVELSANADKVVGSRSGDKALIEEVWFENVNGTLVAYSSLKGNETNIMTTEVVNGVETVLIDAEYFDYIKDETGEEKFIWAIGDITEAEVALSYYVCLKGSPLIDTAPPDGPYFTNESAVLDYIDIFGYHAQQKFERPVRGWGTAITTIQYYLVDEEGKLINWADHEIDTFENRIIVDEDTYTKKFRWGDTLTVSGEEFLPEGYELFNTDNPYYTVTAYEDGSDDGELKIEDDKVVNWPVYESLSNPNRTTQRVDADTSNYGVTTVAFAVVHKGIGKIVKSKLIPDRVVIDYGKPIVEDVLDEEPIMNSKYTAKVVGIRAYEAKESLLEYTQYSKGVSSIIGDYGYFDLLPDGTIQYTPEKLVSDVDRIFAVVEIRQKEGEWSEEEYNPDDYYYLYQEFAVIPATSVYYETDFVEVNEETRKQLINDSQTENNSADASSQAMLDIFTTESINPNAAENADDWSTVYDSNRIELTDNKQDDGSIGNNQRYGYDDSYTEDNNHSDGSSLFVEGAAKDVTDEETGETTNIKTTASFSFTGTGFDIISRTGKTHGTIRVSVYKAGTTTRVKRISVLNKSESDWGELYQIPVISIELEEHGGYDVVIEVYDEATYTGAFAGLSRGDDFYFDAVRIYNPVDVSKTNYTHDLNSLIMAEQTSPIVALNAYGLDGEAYEEVSEVRDRLADGFEVDGSEQNTDGMVFIERPDDNHLFNYADYIAIGPNNETYLSKGQAVAFKITGIDASSIASIDIGAKSVDGKPTELTATISSSVNPDGTNSNTITETIASCTSQYYPLLDNSEITKKVFGSKSDAYVIIANKNSDAVLSITDIKIAYYGTVTATNTVQYLATASLLDFASAALKLEPSYDTYNAKFTISQCKIFGKSRLIITTSQNVDTIKITDKFGIPIKFEGTYEDQSNGTRIWEIAITMKRLGEHTYTITGYGEDGIAGQTAEANVSVTYKEGGGWQDAKSIFKTLFYCRIFSVKRSSGSKLRSIH